MDSIAAAGAVHEQLLTRELTGLYMPARVTRFARLPDALGNPPHPPLVQPTAYRAPAGCRLCPGRA